MLCLLSLGFIGGANQSHTPSEIYNAMHSRNQIIVRDYGKGFDPTRSPKIQAVLLGEHIKWANSNFDDVLVDALVYVSLWQAQKYAKEQLEREGIEFEEYVDIEIFLQRLESTLKMYKEKCSNVDPKKVGSLNITP